MSYPTTPANFRSGDLVQGQPLGATNISVSLSADNQFVSPYGFRDTPAAAQIFLQSDNATASNRTFTLDNGQFIGQALCLVFESGSSYTCELANSGNVKLTAAWTPLQYQSLSLKWDGAYWIEMGRAPASIASTALTSAHVFVGNGSNVATDVAMSGVVAIDNTGATTFASTVSTGTISSTISLTQANIIAMNGTPVQLLAAASAGTYYVIDQIEVIHTYSTAAYTGGGNVQIQYDSGAVAIALFASTIVTAASSSKTVVKPTIYNLDASTGASEGFAVAGAVAKSVTITNATGVFAAGNAANILKLRLTYRIVTALT